MCPAVEDLDLVFQETSNSQSPTHSRPTEHGSRQAIQATPDHPDRMVSPSIGFLINMQQVAPASNRSICHEAQQQVTSMSPVPDPLASVEDKLSLPWEDLDAYAFPPAAILGEKLEDCPCKRIILIAPGWPNMPWFWDLVAMSCQIPLSLPNLPNLLTQPFNQTLQKFDKTKSPYMARRASAIKEQVFSEEVAARIEASQRGSIRSLCEAKWTIFTKWCLGNQVVFKAPPVKSVADLLMYLFQDRKLQPSAIDGYRSVIADKLGDSPINVSKGENFTRLLDSFHKDRPKGWRGRLHLNQLKRPPRSI